MKNVFTATLIILLGGFPVLSAADTAAHEHTIQIGKAVSDRLLGSLKQNLVTTISEKGFVHAVEFCSLQALPLTQTVLEQSSAVSGLKRVSAKFRNPKNAPDADEAKALETFEKLLAEGKSVPAQLVSELKDEFRYYRPLKIGTLCLQCHGTEEDISPEVQSALKTRYPADRATGYRLGDFRGLIRVSIPRSVADTEYSHEQ